MKARDETEKKPPERSFGNTALRDAIKQLRKAAPPPVPPRAPPRPPPKAIPAEDPTLPDDELFRRAMHEVEPIAGAAEPRTAAAPTIREVDEDAEAMAQLAELVATGEGLDLADTDEYLEGIARGVDRGLLDRLRRGDFSVQAHVDLHGLGIDAARAELERFLVESRRAGRRCVLVVHGRGLHSKDQNPVLKTRVGAWLARGRPGRIVLAFATARPIDGGAGALYVLLRR